MFFSNNKVNLYFDKTHDRNYEIIKECPTLYQGDGQFSDRETGNKANEPSVKDNKATYSAPLALYHTHVMNYYSTVARKKLRLKSTREEIIAPDGGTVSLDWYDFGVEFKKDTPTIFILHGLTGGSHEINIQYFAKYAYDTCGFRSVVMNYRGCAGNKVTADMAYCALQIYDAKYVITNHLLPKCEGAPLFAVGFSLGSSMLVNYLADQGDNSPFIAHASISNPIDLVASSRNLTATYLNNKIYNEMLSGNLKRLFKKFGNRLDNYATPEQVSQCKSLYEFDTLITSKMFGFKSAEAFYRAAGSINHIDTLKKPVLFINSLDDPLSPGFSLPFDKFRANPNVILATTPAGGHLGFISGKDWQSWSDKATIEYFKTFLNSNKSN